MLEVTFYNLLSLFLLSILMISLRAFLRAAKYDLQRYRFFKIRDDLIRLGIDNKSEFENSEYKMLFYLINTLIKNAKHYDISAIKEVITESMATKNEEDYILCENPKLKIIEENILNSIILMLKENSFIVKFTLNYLVKKDKKEIPYKKLEHFPSVQTYNMTSSILANC